MSVLKYLKTSENRLSTTYVMAVNLWMKFSNTFYSLKICQFIN